MLRCAVALLTLALLCVGHGAPSCAENGFTDGLVCSSCETLKEIVKVCVGDSWRLFLLSPVHRNSGYVTTSP